MIISQRWSTTGIWLRDLGHICRPRKLHYRWSIISQVSGGAFSFLLFLTPFGIWQILGISKNYCNIIYSYSDSTCISPRRRSPCYVPPSTNLPEDFINYPQYIAKKSRFYPLVSYFLCSVPTWSEFLGHWSEIGPFWQKGPKSGLILHSKMRRNNAKNWLF